jgi:DNA-directed RNA polymerase specialized sigma24 family protein
VAVIETDVSAAFFGDAESPAELEACDAAALEALYPELAPRVVRFLRDLLGDAALATDAAQETFIRAFRRVSDLPRGTRLVP